MIYRTFIRYFTSEQAEQQQQVGQHAWAGSHICSPLEEKPLEGLWLTRLSCPNRLLFWGISQPTLSTSQLICFLSTWPHSPPLGAACNLTSTQRHDPGQGGDFRQLLAKQASGSSLPCPSSHGSCLNPSWNQMVVNVLLLPWSRGQSGGNLAAFSLPLLLGAYSPRHWGPRGTVSGAEGKFREKQMSEAREDPHKCL